MHKQIDVYSVLCCVIAAGLLVACQSQGGGAMPPTIAPPTASAPTTAPSSTSTTVPAPPPDATALPTAAPAGDGETHDLLFGVAAGPDGVTYRGESQTEMQRVGPAAFTVAPDDSFWIADTIGLRVFHYSPTGARLGVTDLADAWRSLVDIEASAEEIFVLDLGPTPAVVLRLAPDGSRRGEYQLPQGSGMNDGLSGLALTAEGDLLAEKLGGSSIVRLLDESGAVNPTPLPGYISHGIVYTARPADYNIPGDHTRGTLTAGDHVIEVDTVHDLGGLFITGVEPDGSFYAELQELGPGVPFQVDQTIRRYAADGTLLGMARFPLAEQYTYVDQAMAVNSDGAVYAMFTRPEGIEIRRMRLTGELKPILPPPGEVPEHGALATYSDPAGRWSIQYPADILHVEDLGQGTTVFISRDRKTVVAVDSYDAAGNAYGNTGEDLRNRARDTLARIYGRPVNETDIVGSRTGGWETGITFTTNKGSTGEAVYQQPGRDARDFQVYGVLYGYKADAEASQLALVQQMRASFQITVARPSGG